MPLKPSHLAVESRRSTLPVVHTFISMKNSVTAKKMYNAAVFIQSQLTKIVQLLYYLNIYRKNAPGITPERQIVFFSRNSGRLDPPVRYFSLVHTAEQASAKLTVKLSSGPSEALFLKCGMFSPSFELEISSQEPSFVKQKYAVSILLS